MATIHVYNTLTRHKEPLKTLQPDSVGMYVCGITPYDDCHIGHLLGPVVFDAVARWLIARGYRVRFVNNITDIDDKIIAKASVTGESWESLSGRYTKQYVDLLSQLHVHTITDQPKCTEYIPEMVAYIERLVASNRAYTAPDGVYFDVRAQPSYGKLSGRKLEDMLAGARIERDAGLRHAADFALWKLAKPGEPSWPSPWGNGRPGWHIECSVMSLSTLGESFDIHGGGDDLKFPHHENEIAQGEAHGGDYAQVWMHNGLIQYEGTKVGKSDPRMKDPAFAQRFKAKYLIDTYGAATIRFLFLQGHYRRPSEFSETAILAAKTALGKLHRQLGHLIEEEHADVENADFLQRVMDVPLSEPQASHRDGFIQSMDDDFGTGTAIAHLFSLTNEARKSPEAQQSQVLRVARDLGRLIGLFLPGDERDTLESRDDIPKQLDLVMQMILEIRQRARAQRQFGISDRIRAGLTAAGITVKDEKHGATWQLTGKADAAMRQAKSLVLDLAEQSRELQDGETQDRIRTVLATLCAPESTP